jgi:Reverse transcriptase (RNA-dependent DNA polymerase)/RNase H-like domain found in reverse transcriptase/Integrase zinc binding domain
MSYSPPPHPLRPMSEASSRHIPEGDDTRQTIEVEPSLPPSVTERRDDTRRTGTILQATTYLENKMHNMCLDINARMDQRMDKIDDQLKAIMQNLQCRPVPTTNADQRGAARYPTDPAFANGNAASPGQTPTPSITSQAGIKIKREDLGVFDPDAEDPKNSGVLMDGRCIVFTDVYSFEQRVLSLMEVEPEQQAGVNSQLVQHFGTCLNSSAMLWWINEVDHIRRREMKSQGIEALLTALVTRFKPTDIKAMDQLYKGRFYIRDMLGNDGALRQYFQRQYRLARSLGIAADSSVNCYAALLTIWRTLDLKSQTFLRQPRTSDTLGGYMKKIEDMTPLLVNAAEQSSNQRSGYQSKYDQRYDRSKESSFRQYDRESKDYPKSNDRTRRSDRDRDRPKQRPEEKNQQQYRDYNRDSRRDRYQDSRDKGKSKEVNQVDEDSECDSDRSKSSPSTASEGVNFIKELDRTCAKCGHIFATISLRESHEKKKLCLPPYVLQQQALTSGDAIPADPQQRTCRRCDQLFESRNKLFQHLAGCIANPTKPSLSAEPEATPEPAHNFTISDQLIVETPPVAQETTTFSSYTHLRIRVQSNQNGEAFDICADPGTGRSIIDREWLKTLEHTIVKKEGSHIRGVGNKRMKVTDWAEFWFYAPARKTNGTAVTIKLQASGWVIDNLEARCLLGNNWLLPRKAMLDYQTGELKLGTLDNMVIPFEVRIQSRACVRKVSLVRPITIIPGKSAWVQVNYKSLPRDRSFALNAIHPSVSNAIVDANSPRTCLLTNPTQEAIRLSKGTRLATITESIDSGYFVSTLPIAWKAIAMASAVGTAATMNTDHFVQGTKLPALNSFTPEQSVIPAMGAEFNLTSEISSALQNPPKQEVATAPADANSQTPLSDAVFNIIQSSTNATARMEPSIIEPKAIPTRTNPAIKTPTDAPELITKEGIHIYAKDRTKASKFEKIIDKYPTIWTDQGIIDLPLEQQLKVPLVDGWQNAKLNSRPYPLSRKDRECLDKTFDPMHEQGRMKWVDEPSPFAHPVFVVWRTVHGNEKGRVVIDMRQLNKYGVPDCCPLPLQHEIIQTLRQKRFITVIDAASFFYQFRVHPDFQDRFTIISPRGIERFTVAPMGYRNSPAYVQRFMDKFLKKHASYCRAFIDDVVIYSNTFEEHRQHLDTIFGLFAQTGISIAPKKSFVGYPSVELLGFQVDALGLSTTTDRMAAFQKLEFPAQLKSLESYLGATGFLRHLIPYYAQLVEPLQKRKTALLAKGRAEGRVVNGKPQKRLAYTKSTYYDPTPEEMVSFQELQTVVCQKIGLAHFNPDSKLFLQIDGSLARGFGVMVFHTQEGYDWEPGTVIPATVIRPVMFLSRCLTSAELHYGPSELEVACLVWAAKKLRTTLHSSNVPVVVLTDHSATKGIVEQTSLNTTSTDRANRRLINASIYLSQYQFDVYHIPGRLNYVPDALSRLHAAGDDTQRHSTEPATLDDVWFASEALMNDEMRRKFSEGYKSDHLYQKIVRDLVGNKEVANASKVGHPFCLVDNLLYNTAQDNTRRLCIPHDLIREILELAHDQKHHFGRDRMMKELSNLHFHRKSYLVKKYCEHCPTCELNRTDRQQALGNYEPIRTPEEPMHTITIDFIVGLPEVSSAGTPWQLDGFGQCSQ